MDKLPRTKLNPTFKSSVQNPQHNSRDALTCKGKPVHHPHPPCNKKTWRFPINPGDRIALPRQFRELLLVDRLLVHMFKPWDAPSIAFRRCFWVWLTWFHHYRSPRLPETSYSCCGLYLQNAWLDIFCASRKLLLKFQQLRRCHLRLLITRDVKLLGITTSRTFTMAFLYASKFSGQRHWTL